MVDAALDGGIDMIDVADLYAGGASERIVGDVRPWMRAKLTP